MRRSAILGLLIGMVCSMLLARPASIAQTQSTDVAITISAPSIVVAQNASPDLNISVLSPQRGAGGATLSGLNTTLLNHNDQADTLPADSGGPGWFFVDLFVFAPGQQVITPTLPLELNPNNPPSAACVQIDKSLLGVDVSLAITQWYSPADLTCQNQPIDLRTLFTVSGIYNVIAAVDTACPGESYGCVNEGTLGGENNNLRLATFSVSAQTILPVIHLPIVRRPILPTLTPTPIATPTSTPKPRCDPYEPNDDRTTNPFGPLVSGQPYSARLCAGDIEDNYFFVTTTADQIQLTMHLPASLVGATYLYIYDRNDLRQNADICKSVTGKLTKADTTILCSIPHTGAYVVRLYADPPTVFDNVNPYTLVATYK